MSHKGCRHTQVPCRLCKVTKHAQSLPWCRNLRTKHFLDHHGSAGLHEEKDGYQNLMSLAGLPVLLNVVAPIIYSNLLLLNGCLGFGTQRVYNAVVVAEEPVTDAAGSSSRACKTQAIKFTQSFWPCFFAGRTANYTMEVILGSRMRTLYPSLGSVCARAKQHCAQAVQSSLHQEGCFFGWLQGYRY